MGIYLRLVHGQFGTVLLRFYFLTGKHLAEKFEGDFNSQSESGYDKEKEPYGLGMKMTAEIQRQFGMGVFRQGKMCHQLGHEQESDDCHYDPPIPFAHEK